MKEKEKVEKRMMRFEISEEVWKEVGKVALSGWSCKSKRSK